MGDSDEAMPGTNKRQERPPGMTPNGNQVPRNVLTEELRLRRQLSDAMQRLAELENSQSISNREADALMRTQKAEMQIQEAAARTREAALQTREAAASAYEAALQTREAAASAYEAALQTRETAASAYGAELGDREDAVAAAKAQVEREKTGLQIRKPIDTRQADPQSLKSMEALLNKSMEDRVRLLNVKAAAKIEEAEKRAAQAEEKMAQMEMEKASVDTARASKSVMAERDSARQQYSELLVKMDQLVVVAESTINENTRLRRKGFGTLQTLGSQIHLKLFCMTDMYTQKLGINKPVTIHTRLYLKKNDVPPLELKFHIWPNVAQWCDKVEDGQVGFNITSPDEMTTVVPDPTSDGTCRFLVSIKSPWKKASVSNQYDENLWDAFHGQDLSLVAGHFSQSMGRELMASFEMIGSVSGSGDDPPPRHPVLPLIFVDRRAEEFLSVKVLKS